ncbi:MAG: PadR family transcriptional regulator [Candidatus Bathyarchaeia archaeon]
MKNLYCINKYDNLDIFILVELAKSPLSGYDIMLLIHKKFNLMMSSGTVYLTLYSLEREGLIKSKVHNSSRKRVYALTYKGEEFIGKVLSLQENIKTIVSKIFDDGKYVVCKSNLTKI